MPVSSLRPASPTFTLGGLSGTGNIALADTASAPVNLQVGANSTPSAYGGVLSGAGGLTKVGNATLTLTAPQTFTGPVTLLGGTLDLSGPTVTLATTSGVTLIGNGKGTPPNLAGDLLPTPVLFLDDGGGSSTNRLVNNVPVTLNGGTIAYNGGPSGSGSSEHDAYECHREFLGIYRRAAGRRRRAAISGSRT